jgi:hypothetical protein
LLRVSGRPDYRRWVDAKNLEDWWEPRTERVAKLVPPGAHVLEFGAGKRRLETYLDSSCSYMPSDLVDRGPGTVICDLNQRPLPDLRHLNRNAAVFVGVLEYIHKLPALVEWLGAQFEWCVASYDAVDSRPWTTKRVVELGRRKSFGYMNNHEPAEFVAIFERAGFRCVRTDRWESQELYLFVRESAVDDPVRS